MFRKSFLVLLVLIVALALAACGGTEPPADEPVAPSSTESAPPAAAEPSGDASALVGSRWTLVELQGNAPVEGKAPTLVFEEGGSVGGEASCNQFGGEYTSASDGTLTFANLFQTQMACAEADRMTQEAAYMAALQSVASYRLAGGRLELLDAAGTIVLAFESGQEGSMEQEEPAVEGDVVVSDLAGTQWLLVSLNGAPVVAGSSVSVQFEEGGALVGNAGCNQFGSQYSAENGKLSISPLGMTRMACADDAVMAQEGAFAAAMESATGYRVVDGRLELLDADGNVVLLLEAAQA